LFEVDFTPREGDTFIDMTVRVLRVVSPLLRGYVSKPIRTSELFSAMETLLATKHPVEDNEAARLPEPIVA
jgi:hypothetical protein